MRAFLLPGNTGIYMNASRLAHEAGGLDTLVLVTLEETLEFLKMGKVSKVIIVMGASFKGNIINPKEAYEKIGEAFPNTPVKVVDNHDWGIPGQHFLPGASTLKVLQEALESV